MWYSIETNEQVYDVWGFLKKIVDKYITIDDFNDFLDEKYGSIEIVRVNFYASEILEQLSPHLYNLEYSGYKIKVVDELKSILDNQEPEEGNTLLDLLDGWLPFNKYPEELNNIKYRN